MAFRVNKSVAWRAGVGTPEKYVFNLDVLIDVVSVAGNTATISIIGTYGVQNNPTNSRNSFAASDFAALSKGDVDPWNYPFTQGQSYYQAALPFATNAPSSVLDGILIEFRGDTWISDPSNNNNRSTLYCKPSGVVLNTYDGSAYQSFSINTTFTLDVSGGGDVPILTWVTSGTDSSTAYSWLQHEVWASWFDLDYRPGTTLKSANPYQFNPSDGVWWSHNRNNGAAHILATNGGSTWTEMRTIGGDSGEMGNPPSILHADNGSWYNQKRLGKE